MKYTVLVIEQTTRSVIVEADNEEDALELAEEAPDATTSTERISADAIPFQEN